MKVLAILIAVWAVVCFAEDAGLAYHDGTPAWLSWGGTYRGTWFDIEDFIPGSSGFTVEWVDIWFFESPFFPWDSDQATVELWNGNQSGPVEFLASQPLTAQPEGTTRVYFDPPVETGPDFWSIINTEQSSGGYPSLLSDGSPGEHSYFSDDYLIWEQYNQGEYFISVGNSCESLCRLSWGSLKTVF